MKIALSLLKPLKANKHKRDLFILCFLLLVGLLSFGSTLNKPLLSDDYDVMYRLVYKKQFWLPGFFRPLSDITLLMTYWISGTNSFLYNFFNLSIHIGCSFLLYKVTCQIMLSRGKGYVIIALSAALLFLIYPFHTEAVFWIVGRGSLLAACCALLCLSLVLKGGSKNILLACLFYFVGLAAYESILFLPVIILVLDYKQEDKMKKNFHLVIFFGLTLLSHVAIRVILAKSIWGNYGQKLFESSFEVYVINFAKVAGRSLLPPLETPTHLVLSFSILLTGLCGVLYLLLKVRRDQVFSLRLLIALIISFIIPTMFGVSTHTFEGGRLLYFPAVFLALWIAHLISLVNSKVIRNIAALSLSLYFLFFLRKSAISYKQAGYIVDHVVRKLQNETKNNFPLAIVNLPQEINGAYVFRNGFDAALHINNIKETTVKVLRTMTSEEAQKIRGAIMTYHLASGFYIPPSTWVIKDSIIIKLPVSQQRVCYNREEFRQLYYWNKEELLLVE